MDEKYYVEFVREGRDASRRIVIVPKELFDKLLPFEADLGFGNWSTAQPWLDEAYDSPEADLRPSEWEAILQDHSIFVACC